MTGKLSIIFKVILLFLTFLFLIYCSSNDGDNNIQDVENITDSKVSNDVLSDVYGKDTIIADSEAPDLCCVVDILYDTEDIFEINPADTSTDTEMDVEFNDGGFDGSTIPDVVDTGMDVCVPDCNGKQCGDDGCGGSCGVCGKNAKCSNFQCVCNNGYENCDNKWSNGCEANLSSDIANCGKCGKACLENERCENFSCVRDYGPFKDFSIFRNVCSTDGTGEHLWAKWKNLKNFELHGYEVIRPDQTKFEKSYYEIPEFYAGFEDVLLLDEDGPTPQGNYNISMYVKSEGDPVVVTIDFENIPVSDEFYKGPQILTVVGTKKGDFGEIILKVKPSFNGTIQRVITYKDGCWMTTKGFYEEPQLYVGYTTEVEIGSFVANSQDPLLVVIEGVNSDTNYTYYTAVEATYP